MRASIASVATGPGATRVDADAAPAEVERGRADDAERGVLARDVARHVRVAAPGVQRRHDDDRRPPSISGAAACLIVVVTPRALHGQHRVQVVEVDRSRPALHPGTIAGGRDDHVERPGAAIAAASAGLVAHVGRRRGTAAWQQTSASAGARSTTVPRALPRVRTASTIAAPIPLAPPVTSARRRATSVMPVTAPRSAAWARSAPAASGRHVHDHLVHAGLGELPESLGDQRPRGRATPRSGERRAAPHRPARPPRSRSRRARAAPGRARRRPAARASPRRRAPRGAGPPASARRSATGCRCAGRRHARRGRRAAS